LEAGSSRDEVTRLLLEVRSLHGEDPVAAGRLFSVVYDELRRLAAAIVRRSPGGLRPTELVHEAYLRLVDANRVAWEDRTHFFGIAARAMRQVLVDHAREHAALKRGGDWTRVTLSENLKILPDPIVEVLDLHTAIEKLSGLNARVALVVELRAFGGLEMQEVAQELGVSKRTVEGDWTFARMWLARELGGGR